MHPFICVQGMAHLCGDAKSTTDSNATIFHAVILNGSDFEVVRRNDNG